MFRLFLQIDRNWPWAFPLMVLAASVLFLAVALVSQYVGGHHPCTLCIAQRTSYVVAGIVSGAALAIGRDPERSVERSMLLGVCGLAFLYGGTTAFKHVGVELGWWPGEVLCDGSMTAFGLNPETARLTVNPLFNVPEFTCAKGTWSLFGLSMATYNMFANVGLLLLCSVLAVAGLRQRSERLT